MGLIVHRPNDIDGYGGEQLYLSRCRVGPIPTALAQGVRYGNELCGDGGDDDPVWSSGPAEVVCEAFQARILVCGDQGSVEHHMPQITTTTGNGPFPAKSSAVACDRRRSSGCYGLFAGGRRDLRHFCDRRCAGNRADARDGAEDDVHEHPCGPQFLMRANLRQQSFAHLDQLRPFGLQGSESAQLLSRKLATCLTPERKEADDEFRINLVGLGARVKALRKCLHLSGRHLARCNAFSLQNPPELPFLTASRIKTYDGVSVPGKIRYGGTNRRSIWHSDAMHSGEAMKVKPIAADICADVIGFPCSLPSGARSYKAANNCSRRLREVVPTG